jgi:hypothetical protein
MGHGYNGTITDKRGTTNNIVGGSRNNVNYIGDSGANTFSIGGKNNKVSVSNLGGDDTVNLQGKGWMVLPDSNKRDGKVMLYNPITNNRVAVNTDGGRNDDFIFSHINGNIINR